MVDRPLEGLRVLVIEDDYYIATDEQQALQDAGAVVIGPYAQAADAMASEGPVDCAVVDINLGRGPSFEAAATLRGRSIPFLFTTGYDAGAIPREFADVPRLEKPIREADLVAAIIRMREAS